MLGQAPEWHLLDLTERPELTAPANELVGANLPEFMSWESPGNWRWHRIYELFPHYQVCAVDDAGELMGVVNGVPLRWSGDPVELPAGYDDVLVSVVDRDAAHDASHTCLLSVSVAGKHRGSGLARALLADARERAAARGHAGLVIPLRPTAKHRYPLVPITEYAAWPTADGNAFDPWLRLHLETGASVVGVAERSLVIRQPAQRWEALTGLPMPGPGSYTVEGALAPVERDVDGFATYAEPNIWVRHAV